MTTSGWIIWSHVSQRLVYLVLLCLAIYLIYIGDIVQKFCRKRSNFAEYSEEISELPVVHLFLEYRTPSDILNYGKDFLVTYQGNDFVKNLTMGENIVEGVQMDLEERFERSDNTTIYFTYQSLFLRPGGFKSKLLLPYNLMLTFGESGSFGKLVSRAGITLTTSNNTYCGEGISHLDGDYRDVFTKMGELNHVSIRPEKYIYLQEIETCRKQHYQKIIYEQISKRIFEKCVRPCKPHDWHCTFGVALDQVSLCESATELECFQEVAAGVKKETVTKPCNLLQYKVLDNAYPIKPQNQAGFRLSFQTPLRVSVKEEYLIYDMLTMVSAIGGTMGLCIGYSFYEFFIFMWNSGSIIFKSFLSKTIIPTNTN